MEMKIRASSLPSLASCERRWLFENSPEIFENAGFGVIDKPRQQIAATFGTAAHKGVEYALISKRDSRVPETREILGQAMEGFKAVATEDLEFDDVTRNSNHMRDQLSYVITVFSKIFLPKIEPLFVEQAYKATLDGVEVSGHVDIITDSGAVIDFKTSKVAGNFSAQLGMYSILSKANTGRSARTLGIVGIPRSGGDPYTQPYSVKACEKYAVDLVRRGKEILQTQDISKAGCNPGALFCSKRYCALFGSEACQATRGQGEKVIFTF